VRTIGFERANQELSDYIMKFHLILKGGQDAHGGGQPGSPGLWLEPSRTRRKEITIKAPLPREAFELFLSDLKEGDAEGVERE